MRSPGRVRAALRSMAASLCAVGLVATVIPLVVLQIPDAIAWSLPPRLAAGGSAVVASLLRASGLALPAMAVAGSPTALAVRWLRAGPVLLAGLLALAAADMLGDAARTVALIGVDRSLHGAGAGIAMVEVVAIAGEQRTQRRSTPGQPRQRWPKRRPPEARPPDARHRLLAGWWAAVTVAGLAAAPELMRHRVSPDRVAPRQRRRRSPGRSGHPGGRADDTSGRHADPGGGRHADPGGGGHAPSRVS